MRRTESTGGRRKPAQGPSRAAIDPSIYVCPKCGLTFRFVRQAAGHELICPECGTRLIRKLK